MKNGATPDVIIFIETTITEVNHNVSGQIVDEHHCDQALIGSFRSRRNTATGWLPASLKECRSQEALDCARSCWKEEELEHLWVIVRLEEEEMRLIHRAIHGQWCLGSAPEHPSLAFLIHWTNTEYTEGA